MILTDGGISKIPNYEDKIKFLLAIGSDPHLKACTDPKCIFPSGIIDAIKEMLNISIDDLIIFNNKIRNHLYDNIQLFDAAEKILVKTITITENNK